MTKQIHSRILFYLRFFLFNFVVFYIFRLVFYFAFSGNAAVSKTSEIFQALYLGGKFDIRLAAIMLLPLILFSWFGPLKLPREIAKKIWLWFYGFLATAIFLLYFMDFAYYSYLQGRINASATSFLQNLTISAQMVWETYPFIRLVIALAILVALYVWALKKIIFPKELSFQKISVKPRVTQVTIFTLLVILGIHEKLSQYPLRWSEAFFAPNSFLTSLSLNPVLYLADTFQFKAKEENPKEVHKYYDLIADYLGVKDKDPDKLEYARKIRYTTKPPFKPNIVIVVMESLAISKTNLMNNILKPTPFLESLAKDSYYFPNYYVPSEATARSMFCLMTSIPDLSTQKTASRNPLIVDQNVIMNAFDGYKKFYFLGGSANWGNIRGVFSNNVKDIDIVEEGQYSAPRTDVWGIADIDLFEESAKILNEQDGNFFAVIQTSGYHRPFTIPENKRDFQIKTASEADLKKGGYISAAEYNSIRFSDYSLQHFFEIAKQQKWYENTIFVVVGDHGLPEAAATNVSEARKQADIEKFHVPFIIHNNKLFPTPKVDTRIASEVDVMTTIASLAKVDHLNTTLGRDLFDPQYDDKRYALIYTYYSLTQQYGLLDQDYYLKNDALGNAALFKYNVEGPLQDVTTQEPERFTKMRDLAKGLYETAKHMLYNNPKRDHKAN